MNYINNKIFITLYIEVKLKAHTMNNLVSLIYIDERN